MFEFLGYPDSFLGYPLVTDPDLALLQFSVLIYGSALIIGGAVAVLLSRLVPKDL